SDHAAGPNRTSDTGGDSVTVTASGLSGGITLHWYPAGQGIQPSDSNRLDYQLYGDHIVFTSPGGLAGQTYQIALVRAATDELVESASGQQLLVVDDTAPKVTLLQNLGYTDPLILRGSEPIRATSAVSFSVTKTFKDYADHAQPTIDISERFDRLLSQGNNLILRLKTGSSLEHNAIYNIRIDGLQDQQGNPAQDNDSVSGGVYGETFVANDLLAPAYDSISLKLAGGAAVTPATQFKHGSSYALEVSAVDNFVTANNIVFTYRISGDGGKSYSTGWLEAKGGSIPLSVDKAFTSLQLLVRASDGTNSIERAFSAAIIDPNIESSGFSTEPSPVEELQRADLIFDLTGDVELIRSAWIKVADNARIPVTFDQSSHQARLSYLNPKLSSLLPEGADKTPVDVPVTLYIGYGFSGQETYSTFEGSYQLMPDITLPTLQIVAPADGDLVPRGEPVDVLLSSFDRFGVDHVEVCLNSTATPDPFTDSNACHRLDNPNRFSFTVAADEQAAQRIDARAVDLNGLVSLTASITLYPYDGEAGAPALDLLKPENGLQVHANEPIPLRLRMRHLTEATLSAEIGADPNTADTQTITRAADASEIVDQTFIVPDVTENTLLLLKTEATYGDATLTSERYLNVLADNGIDQAVELTLVPESEVLGGTELWLSSGRPAEMDDFSESSIVAVSDPVDATEIQTVPMDGERHAIAINDQGTAVKVDAILRDRSSHEQLRSEQLTKIPYLQAGRTTVYSSSERQYRLLGLTLVPGAAQELVWAENHADDGYRIRTQSQMLDQQPAGEVVSLLFTGTGLAVQVRRNGEDWLRFMPFDGSGFTTAVEFRLLGDLVGANGDLLYLRHGNLLSGLYYQSGALLPVAGIAIAGT
ncbi:MAG: hypothetical protein P8178_18625, partial [Candidatus Thiodiazotropha sp.]